MDPPPPSTTEVKKKPKTFRVVVPKEALPKSESKEVDEPVRPPPPPTVGRPPRPENEESKENRETRLARERQEAKEAEAESEVVAPLVSEKPSGKSRKPKEFRVVQPKAKPEKPYEKQIAEFYKARQKDPINYTYSEEGNLVIKENGVETKVIHPRKSRPLTAEEVLELETQRKEKLAASEKACDEAVNNLRIAEAEYKAGTGTIQNVFNMNKEVKRTSAIRQAILYPEQYTTVFDHEDVRDVRFDLPPLKGKLGYPVFAFQHVPMKKADFFGKYMTSEEEAAKASESKEMEGGAEMYILDTPDDPTLGMFHPAYTKEFSYTGTQYSSPLQAFEVERLRGLKNDALADQLLKTRSARTIHNLATQDKTPAQNALGLWTGILKAFYKQHTDLGKQLTETGDTLFTLRDLSIPSPHEYLQALLLTRSNLREGAEQMGGDPVTRRVISEEEQKKARTAAIIRNKMNAHFR